jgi:hypothetical protein
MIFHCDECGMTVNDYRIRTVACAICGLQPDRDVTIDVTIRDVIDNVTWKHLNVSYVARLIMERVWTLSYMDPSRILR